jgi:hypothetical protein
MQPSLSRLLLLEIPFAQVKGIPSSYSHFVGIPLAQKMWSKLHCYCVNFCILIVEMRTYVWYNENEVGEREVGLHESGY